jgi:hypothetical protein
LNEVQELLETAPDVREWVTEQSVAASWIVATACVRYANAKILAPVAQRLAKTECYENIGEGLGALAPPGTGEPNLACGRIIR